MTLELLAAIVIGLIIGLQAANLWWLRAIYRLQEAQYDRMAMRDGDPPYEESP